MAGTSLFYELYSYLLIETNLKDFSFCRASLDPSFCRASWDPSLQPLDSWALDSVSGGVSTRVIEYVMIYYESC
jgi:hypothetical protein